MAHPQPALHDLVQRYGGYHRVPADAWAQFDQDTADWQARRIRPRAVQKKRQSSCIRSIGSQSVSTFSLRFDCVLFVMRNEPISEASIPTGNQRENLSSFPDFRSSIGRLLFGGIIENVPDSRAHVTDRYQPAA
jgi:hypothetical protein